MSIVTKLGISAFAVAICIAAAPSAFAQETDKLNLPAVAVEAGESLYYQQPTYRPDPRMIIHQKAQTRAQERMNRMASLSWYGMSNSRPTAAGTPFTSRYSPVWEMPGGRPFAWYPRQWPAYVVYSR